MEDWSRKVAHLGLWDYALIAHGRRRRVAHRRPARPRPRRPLSVHVQVGLRHVGTQACPRFEDNPWNYYAWPSRPGTSTSRPTRSSASSSPPTIARPRPPCSPTTRPSRATSSATISPSRVARNSSAMFPGPTPSRRRWWPRCGRTSPKPRPPPATGSPASAWPRPAEASTGPSPTFSRNGQFGWMGAFKLVVPPSGGLRS